MYIGVLFEEFWKFLFLGSHFFLKSILSCDMIFAKEKHLVQEETINPDLRRLEVFLITKRGRKINGYRGQYAGSENLEISKTLWFQVAMARELYRSAMLIKTIQILCSDLDTSTLGEVAIIFPISWHITPLRATFLCNLFCVFLNILRNGK